MDNDARKPDCEHYTAASASHHEALLTGHVLQQLPTRPSHIRASVQYPSSPSSPSEQLPQHPFDFPTLNLDGSLSDPTPLQSARRYPPTPPAALSSLGAKARMENQNGFASDSDLTDSQYDMIDDLSEISTDDHDTASIASNGDEGQLTPEDASSEADADDSTLLCEEQQIYTPPSTAQSFVNLPAQGSDSTDSHMSDDLETPRQSLMPISFTSTIHKSITNGEKATQLPGEDIHRILFVSDRNVSQDLMDNICTRVAACIKQSDAGDRSVYRVVRLPTTPSGISPLSATVVCGDDSVSSTVQHCIDAEVRSRDTFKLRVQDSDGEHSSFFTVGADVKLDLVKPDIAVFHLDERAASMKWLATAAMAVKALNTPILVIHHPSLSTKFPSPALRPLLRKSTSNQSIVSHEFLEKSRSDLSEILSQIIDGTTASTNKHNHRNFKVTPVRVWTTMLAMFALALLRLLPDFFSWSQSFSNPKFEDPAVTLAMRRSGLVEALSQVTTSSNVTKHFDINHLLPEASAPCADCKPNVHFQAVLPNHVIVSLPRQPNFPEVTNTHVLKAGGREINFNQSQLIEGVHMVTFDPDEAYGVVTVNMLTRKPYLNVTAPHNYGSRMLQLTGKEVGKAVSKDVAIMRSAAKTLKNKLTVEFGAGVWATKNITTQLALYVARDLQVFGNSAASFLGKAAQASNYTASNLGKELILVQRDLIRFSKDLSATVKSKAAQAKSNSKALIRSPLAMSRGRLQGFKKAFGFDKETTEASVKADVSKDYGLRKSYRKACTHHPIKEEESKAMSIVPESSPSPASTLNAKREVHKAAQKLKAASKLIKNGQDKNGEKLSKSELRRLKKEAKQHANALKNMKADVEQNART